MLAARASISRTTSSPPKIRLSPCLSVSVVERTTPPARPTDSIRALSWRGVGRLGELDVDRDRLGARFAQAVDHPCVQRAREGPLHAEFAEGAVVDRDDDDVVRPLLGPPHREAGVDGLQLQAAHQVGRVGDDRDRRGGDDDEEDRQFAAPPQLARGGHSETAVVGPLARPALVDHRRRQLVAAPVPGHGEQELVAVQREQARVHRRPHRRRARNVVQQGDLPERFARPLVAAEGPVFEDLDLAVLDQEEAVADLALDDHVLARPAPRPARGRG